MSGTPTPRAADGVADFDATLLRGLLTLPFFRLASAAEVETAYASYQRVVAGTSSADELCRTWASLPATRATMPGIYARLYARIDRAPPLLSGLSFLTAVRGVLAAGARFRAGLRADVRAALETEFPWLEHRHEHIPSGYTPHFEFPPAFAAFLERGTLDDARVRWQLACALNEVQQASYSAFAAERCRLPALALHAARERALAANYLGHAAPAVSFELFWQCVVILDGLNAAVFDMTCRTARTAILSRALFGALTGAKEWRAFEDAVTTPQRLVPVPERSPDVARARP
jgi:hypothetical protein